MPDPSFILPLLLQSAVIPFGVALVAALALRKTMLAAPVAIAFGFIASYFSVYLAQWSFPPQQALDWLPWLTLLIVPGATMAGTAAFPRLALSLATAAIVAWPALPGGGLQMMLATTAVAGVLMFLAWACLARTSQTGPTALLLLTVVAGGAGMAMMMDASLLLGQLTGALALTFAACASLALGRLRIPFSGAATGVAVLLLGALLTYAWIYAGFSLGYVILLATGVLADPVMHAINRFRRSESWMPAVVLSAIPVLVTVGLVAKAAQDSGGY